MKQVYKPKPHAFHFTFKKELYEKQLLVHPSFVQIDNSEENMSIRILMNSFELPSKAILNLSNEVIECRGLHSNLIPQSLSSVSNLLIQLGTQSKMLDQTLIRKALLLTSVEIERWSVSSIDTRDLALEFGERLTIKCSPQEIEECIQQAKFGTRVLLDNSWTDVQALKLIEDQRIRSPISIDGTYWLGGPIRFATDLGANIRKFRPGINARYMLIALQNGVEIEIEDRKDEEVKLLAALQSSRLTVDCTKQKIESCQHYLELGLKVTVAAGIGTSSIVALADKYPGLISVSFKSGDDNEDDVMTLAQHKLKLRFE